MLSSCARWDYIHNEAVVSVHHVCDTRTVLTEHCAGQGTNRIDEAKECERDVAVADRV